MTTASPESAFVSSIITVGLKPRTPPQLGLPLNALRVTADGHLFVPGVPDRCTLTDDARGQLAGLVGVDLGKLVEAVVPGDRAQLAHEANQRLYRVPADVRVQIEAETTADGVVVTDVSPVTKAAA